MEEWGARGMPDQWSRTKEPPDLGNSPGKPGRDSIQAERRVAKVRNGQETKGKLKITCSAVFWSPATHDQGAHVVQELGEGNKRRSERMSQTRLSFHDHRSQS